MSKDLEKYPCGCVIKRTGSQAVIKPCKHDCINYLRLSGQVKNAGGKVITSEDITQAAKRVPKWIKHKLHWEVPMEVK